MGRRSDVKKPRNHGTYTIWYDGQTHAASVESVDVRDVWRLTRRSPEAWRNQPGVTIHTHELRATKVGDLIVDPGLDAWRVDEDVFEFTTPPQPVAASMARHGMESPTLGDIRRWARDYLRAIDPPTHGNCGESDPVSKEK